MKTMIHKGWAARIDYDGDDEIFVGHLAGVGDIVGFHADTVKGLKLAFHEAVDDYIASCAAAGKDPERPCSGQIMVRVDPAVHAKALLAAQLSGKSLAKWAEEKLDGAARRELGEVAV
ncbi:MAG TPA: type II toxin-antitoxin system HicB family antitoxin [Caulobacteraceae bacterium]|nr:type II toxin-antitoxin system HicB family antitoxin [Caulobacteraceae bacterium]